MAENTGAASQRQRDEGSLVTLSTRVPASLRTRLRVYAAQNDESVQDLVERAVDEYLTRHNG